MKGANSMNLTQLILGPDVGHQLKRIADSLERLSPAASPSEPCCPSREAVSQGDPHLSSLEAALSDQAESWLQRVLDRLQKLAADRDGLADGLAKYDGLRAKYERGQAAGIQWAAAILQRAMNGAQSAAVEAQGGTAPDGSMAPPSGARLEWDAMAEAGEPTEAEGASGSDNDRGMGREGGAPNQTPG